MSNVILSIKLCPFWGSTFVSTPLTSILRIESIHYGLSSTLELLLEFRKFPMELRCPFILNSSLSTEVNVYLVPDALSFVG